jgi:hypothetical protein
MNRSEGDLSRGVDRQEDVTDPVHKLEQSDPDEVRIVPRRLAGECLQGAQQT